MEGYYRAHKQIQCYDMRRENEVHIRKGWQM